MAGTPAAAGPPARLHAGGFVSLRVIAGEFGGRRLRAPAGTRTRPTRSAVREAWFNAIAAHLPGACVIDLFAGSGALGIEALSRGARSVRFVESDTRVVNVLRANLEMLELSARTEITRMDVFRALESVDSGAYDVALADPPYDAGLAERLLGVWQRRPFAGILCVEHGRDELTDRDADWRRVYGETGLSFFMANEET